MFIDLHNGVNIIKHKKIIEKKEKKDNEEKDDHSSEDSNNLNELIKDIRKYQDVYDTKTQESSSSDNSFLNSEIKNIITSTTYEDDEDYNPPQEENYKGKSYSERSR